MAAPNCRLLITFVLVAFSFILAAHGFRAPLRNPGMFDIVRLQDDSAVAEWDSFVFSVQWPITTCITWKESKPTHTCILPSISSAANNSSSNNRYWTVHGVWPSRTGSPEGPFFCNRTWEFNPEGVATLRSQLVKLWPNIHGDDTEDSLWRHEWDKHGTCAAVDQRFASEELYFNQGIQWVEQFQMDQILDKHNILPSLDELYNATSIWLVVKAEIGAAPTISCVSDKETGLTYLSEIRMCFRRVDLQLIDCNEGHHNSNSISNCPPHKLIHYPGSVTAAAAAHHHP